MILALLLQVADPVAPAKPDPFSVLKGTVVDAIRNCGGSINGEINVCSRDRGFAEEPGRRRLPKLVKPRVVHGEPAIRLEATTGPNVPPPPKTLLDGG